jgi:hypothetical protein
LEKGEIIVKKGAENYLERVPVRAEWLNWADENGVVTLLIENKGVMNRIFQRLLKKPKTSYIHLDETGSAVWRLIDGQRTVNEIGALLEDSSDEKGQSTYQRLAEFIGILERNRFISTK